MQITRSHTGSQGPVHILGKNCPRSDPHIAHMWYYLGPHMSVQYVLTSYTVYLTSSAVAGRQLNSIIVTQHSLKFAFWPTLMRICLVLTIIGSNDWLKWHLKLVISMWQWKIWQFYRRRNAGFQCIDRDVQLNVEMINSMAVTESLQLLFQYITCRADC